MAELVRKRLKFDKPLQIGDDTVVYLLEIHKTRVVLGFETDKHISVAKSREISQNTGTTK